MKNEIANKRRMKIGDRVWLQCPTNATVKSINKKYGLTLLLDVVEPNTTMSYFSENEVELCSK